MTSNDCKQFSFEVYILGLTGKYIQKPLYRNCEQIIYKENITNFFKETYMKNLTELKSVLDSPALVIYDDHGILISKIRIKIIGMMPEYNVQIFYKNTDAIEGNLI